MSSIWQVLSYVLRFIETATQPKFQCSRPKGFSSSCIKHVHQMMGTWEHMLFLYMGDHLITKQDCFSFQTQNQISLHHHKILPFLKILVRLVQEVHQFFSRNNTTVLPYMKLDFSFTLIISHLCIVEMFWIFFVFGCNFFSTMSGTLAVNPDNAVALHIASYIWSGVSMLFPLSI